MKQHKKLRGILATVGAAVATAAVALSGAAAANAVAPDSQDVIITYTDTTPGEVGDGTQQSVTGEAVTGATFTAWKYSNIDMLTNEGQQQAATKTASIALDDLSQGELEEVTAQSTDDSGVATFAALEPGLYLFQNTGVDAGELPAAPFLTALPMTNPAGNALLDEVYVYPKQSSVGVTKTVDTGEFAQAGDSVTWTIESGVPTVSEITEYRIVDPLAAELSIENIASDVTVTAENTGGALPLTRETDYTVEYDADAENTLEIVFTAEGRTKLAQAAQESATTVSVEVTTSVAEDFTGTIQNVATLYVNGGEIDSTDPDGENPNTQLRLGTMQIVKESDDGNTPLAGATFDLYTVDPSTEGAQPVEEGLTTQDGDGTVFTENVYMLSNTGSDSGRTFWLVETQAPENHQLLAAPIEVAVDFAADNWDENEGVYTVDTIINVKTANGFVLPLTGGMGTVFLTLIGLAILTFVLVIARKRRTAQAQE